MCSAFHRFAGRALLIVVGMGAGCRPPHNPPPYRLLPAATVRAVVVQPATRIAYEEAVGTVRAKLRASVEPKVSARIEALRVVPGQRVKAGDLIAQLDAREFQARLDQSLAVRAQTTRELDRARSLLEQKTLAPAEFDLVEARARISEGAFQEAEAMLAHTRVVAPFEGIVTRKFADAGDLAAPGRPIVELEDPTALRFEADVSEALIAKIESGKKLEVRVGAAPAALDGTVVEIAPVADPASRTFLVKLDLPAAERLRSGQFGRVLVPTGETRSLLVPFSALVVRGQLETIFVVDEQVARLRLVRTGRRLENEVELISGLSPGESVVFEGAERLQDGQPLALRP